MEHGRWRVLIVLNMGGSGPSPSKSCKTSLTTPTTELPWSRLDLFPSERGALVAENTLLRRFRRYCRDLELPDGLDLHSLRRSYATHLIEDGWDAKFVQDQMGHDHASTTSLYTCVSSDYRVTTLRRVLDSTVTNALSFGEES
jgi:integrase/recombinase XerD